MIIYGRTPTLLKIAFPKNQELLNSNLSSPSLHPSHHHSEKEASVLLTNSWLYHYYSVQSKIQFGLSYDTQQQQQQPPHPNLSPRLAEPHSPSMHLSHHHQHFYAAASPIQPQALNHHHLPYGSPHYSYGYQTTISGGGGVGGGSSGGGQQQQTHHNHSHIIMNLNGSTTNIAEDRPKTPPTKRRAELSSSSSSSSSLQQQQQTGPSSKKRAISRLEPIYIPDQCSSPPEDHSGTAELRNGFGGSEHSSNQTVIMGTISYARPRTKFVAKLQNTPLLDTTDFMEQWNPSPPWSEAAQKVPDIGPQELSPYMTTTTPPTPNSANIITPTAAVNVSHLSATGGALSGPKSVTNSSLSGHGSAFSFDWVPEQFVPVATTDCSLALPPPPPPINCVSFLPQELSHRPFSHWPAPGIPSNAHLLASNGYEEAHLIQHYHQQQQQHRGVNIPINGDILTSSGVDKGVASNNNINNGRDSDEDHQQQQQHHHPAKGH